jgi:hypothetical protein
MRAVYTYMRDLPHLDSQEFSELRSRIQSEYREVVERRVYTVTGARSLPSGPAHDPAEACGQGAQTRVSRLAGQRHMSWQL